VYFDKGFANIPNEGFSIITVEKKAKEVISNNM
jgi:hypothetical protein